jgi:putative GTP pyrophosphokinase
MSERLSFAETRAFLVEYEKSRPLLAVAAVELKQYLARVLSDANIAPHMISVRVKDVDSVRGKLLRKDYQNPRRQLTDVIGARIILYRGEDVDRVAELLRGGLKVRERDSADKRLSLGLREFGYRSYHLIGGVNPAVHATRGLLALRTKMFEIQVRSILEHVWAEIEHSVAYKSGAELPSELKRRFASLAAVLEMLEHEFSTISKETSALVDVACSRIRSGKGLRLDVPTLLAWLEVNYSDGLSFRRAARSQNPFPPGIEQRFVLVLQRIRCVTTQSLGSLMRGATFVRVARRYAGEIGESPVTLSHLARLALAVGVRSREAFATFFPEFIADVAMSSALGSIRRRRRSRSKNR